MQKRSQETRTRILSAALELFSQSGYQAAGVAEICQAAGVSKGAFYHHFPAKQAVFLELLHGWLAILDGQMQVAQQQARSVPQALLDMAEGLQSVFQQSSRYLPMFLEFWTQASRDPEIWRQVIAPYHRYQEYFKTIMQQGIDEGSLRPGDADTAARLLVAAAVGLLLQSVLEPEETSQAYSPRASIEILLQGLAQ
ncbi:MAG: TetR/AcrR family transcriptional regulator [Chloroflexota bacterium]